MKSQISPLGTTLSPSSTETRKSDPEGFGISSAIGLLAGTVVAIAMVGGKLSADLFGLGFGWAVIFALIIYLGEMFGAHHLFYHRHNKHTGEHPIVPPKDHLDIAA